MMNQKYFLVIACLLIFTNLNFVYAVEGCSADGSIEIIKGLKANRTKCDEVVASKDEEFTLKFLACSKIKLIQYEFETNEGDELYLGQKGVPIHYVFNKNELVYNRHRDLKTITYIPSIECEYPNGINLLKPEIKVYPSEHFPPLPTCTEDDWSCSSWKPKICPESERVIRNCTISNTNCLNPNHVKPSEIRNCEYVPPKTPITQDQLQCIGKNWFSCNVINIGEFNFITFIKNLNISVKIILSFSIILSLYVIYKKIKN